MCRVYPARPTPRAPQVLSGNFRSGRRQERVSLSNPRMRAIPRRLFQVKLCIGNRRRASLNASTLAKRGGSFSNTHRIRALEIVSGYSSG
jgi:hypothetical protein